MAREATLSWCSGFSFVVASLLLETQALGAWASVATACRLSHRLQSMGSVVVARGLNCSKACRIFPDSGLNCYPLHCKVTPYSPWGQKELDSTERLSLS